MFTREEIEKKLKERAESANFRIFKKTVKPIWTPLSYVGQDSPNGTFVRTVGISAKMISLDTDARSHIVTVGYDGVAWFLSVGNKFLSGDISTDDATLACAKIAKQKVEDDEMMSLYSMFEEEVASSHWRTWYSAKEIVPEVRDFLSHLKVDDLDAIESHFHGQTQELLGEEERIAARMNLYAFKRHLLFIGEKGSGKTHDIYAYMDRHEIDHVFIGGNADVEAIDLKGNLLPFEKNGEKNFIWVDGPLTQAFRRAEKGEKIILFIDELLRMSPSAQSLLVPALTTDIHGNYVLDTGRVIDVIDGVGKTECIKAPASNLWVLATTNMGAEYGVPDMESALEDRFELIEKNNDIEKIRRVLTEIAEEKGYDVSIVANLTDFYIKMVTLKEEEILQKLINLRHLAQALEDTTEASGLYDCLMDRVPKWVERDMGGKLLKEQIEAVKRALRKADIHD